jgi:hypothetical protein
MDVEGLFAAQILASFCAYVWWLTSPERLVSFAWRIANRERKPATADAWLTEFDSLVAIGAGMRSASLRFMGRALKRRFSDLIHPGRTWKSRKLDTQFGGVNLIMRAEAGAEVSIAADKGGPKETYGMVEGTVLLLPGIHRDTNVIVTATNTFGHTVDYWDGERSSGLVTIRPRRTTRFNRRRPAQPILIRNPLPQRLDTTS